MEKNEHWTNIKFYFGEKKSKCLITILYVSNLQHSPSFTDFQEPKTKYVQILLNPKTSNSGSFLTDESGILPESPNLCL